MSDPRFTPNGLITLATDFSLSDPFVGVMKGVILSRFAGARIVDVTHGIPPQDLRTAAYWVPRYMPWFPAGSVHVVVVDPTVGTSRRTLCAFAFGSLVLVPDNGILGPHFTCSPSFRVFHLAPERFSLPTMSCTFHGRDLFSPAASALASGEIEWDAVGPEASQLAEPVLQPAVRTATHAGAEVRGEVVAVDHFGNLITNIEQADLPARPQTLSVAGHEIPFCTTYADVEPRQPVALINSFGSVEIAIREGSAADFFHVDRPAREAGVGVRALCPGETAGGG